MTDPSRVRGGMVMPGFYRPGSEEQAIARAISMGQYQGPL
jgi:hypothetical protein